MSEMNLVGIHAKLRRAEEQIQQITDEAHRLCNDVREGIVREVRDDVDEQVWIYRGPTPTVPVEWSVMIGEILYNIRSALDHLIWQLVLTNGLTPGRHNEFPIAKDHKRWQQEKARVLKGVSQRHQVMIGYLQPFTGGTGLSFGVSNLKVLDCLSNTEKHRHVVVAVIASSGIERTILGVTQPELSDFDSDPPLKGSVYHARIEPGRILAEFNNANTPLCPSFRVDCRLAGEAQRWTMGASLPTVLAKCLQTVKGSVGFLTTSMGNACVEAVSKP